MNKYICEEQVNAILNTSELNIKVHNIIWYKRSFALQCFVDEINSVDEVYKKSNETLELLGDSVIGCIIVEYLEERYLEEREGFISLLKMYLTKTEGLSYFANKLKFREWMLLSRESEELKLKSELDGEVILGRDNPAFLENCFEAFIGALFTDYKYTYNSGEAYNACKKFLVYLIEKFIDFSEIILRRDNYKNILQHYYHTKKWPLPLYTDLKMENDNAERKLYTRGIYLPRFLLSKDQITYLLQKYNNQRKRIVNDTILVGVGVSYKKKTADQICAKDALSYFSSEELEIQVIPQLN